MRPLSIVFKDRNFINPHVNPINFEVEEYSYSAIGGCDEAIITCTGGQSDIWDLVNWLRKPITIYDALGVSIWWGYLHEVVINHGALQVAANLDTMYNDVAVTYSFIELGTQTVGTRKTTAWAYDLDSQAEYGIKSFRSSAGGMSDASANSLRDAILSAHAWPHGGVSQSKKAFGRRSSNARKDLTATLRCKGWWSTLGWKYYQNASTISAQTTDQIAIAVATCGQFFTATNIDTSSGIYSSQYRDGDNSALAEILSLLSAGTVSGQRLLSWVDNDQRVRIYSESPMPYYMDNCSLLYGAGGVEVNEYFPPVGVWCRLKDVIPATVDLTKLVDPTLQFIEASSWSATYGAQYRFRGQPDTASLLAIGG